MKICDKETPSEKRKKKKKEETPVNVPFELNVVQNPQNRDPMKKAVKK